MINDIQLPESEPLYCYAITSEVKSTNKFKQPLFISVKCELGKINIAFWITENISGFNKDDPNTWPIKTNEYFVIYVKNYEKAKNEWNKNDIPTISLQGNYKSNFAYEIVNEKDVPENILRKIKVNRSKKIKDAQSAIKCTDYWDDKIFSKILIESISLCGEKFLYVPAAIGKHHAYEYGLLIHSYEVWLGCKNYYEFNQQLYEGFINKDVLYLSAWLHDIGKTEVYDIDENDNLIIDDKKEKQIGHSIISNDIFREVAIRNQLDKKIMHQVSHCILSHHQLKEWNAVVSPQSLEAEILSRIDCMNARVAALD
jgi:23S rRNA maturation-related 3'-5' exoribonuclease YhaM